MSKSRKGVIGAKRTDPRATYIRFFELDGGCSVPVSHMLNQDGYFRKTWGAKQSDTAETEMFHRFIYRAHHNLDAIPKGHEIDHICRNRACSNPEHLRLLTRQDHLIHTNQNRYKERHDAARQYWIETSCTGTYLAERFGVSFGQGCRWIRKWKNEQ